MNNHIYTIATERELVEDYFVSCVNEVKHMQEKINKEVPFVIIDESDKYTQKYNENIINNNKEKQVNIIHLNSEKQFKIFDCLKDKLHNKDLINLIDYEGYSYARAMNKQFLVANLYNADYIHRRDSDVKIINEKFGFPSDIEIKYLGKKIQNLYNDNLDNINYYNDNQIIYLVGSGYSNQSDWKADFRVFMEQDTELIAEIANLFGYGKELASEYLNEILTGNVTVQGDVKFLPEKGHPNPICGNISFYKIFNYLPCCTILSTIGSDNLIRGYLKRLHSPIIYHSNFVYHQFSKDRENNNIEYLKSYWERLINKLIYYKIIEEVIYDFDKTKRERLIEIENVDFKNLMNIELITVKYIEKMTAECINAYLKIMAKAKNPKIKILHDYFITDDYFDETVKNVYTSLINGHILLNNWQEITESCRNININFSQNNLAEIF